MGAVRASTVVILLHTKPVCTPFQTPIKRPQPNQKLPPNLKPTFVSSLPNFSHIFLQTLRLLSHMQFISILPTISVTCSSAGCNNFLFSSLIFISLTLFFSPFCHCPSNLHLGNYPYLYSPGLQISHKNHYFVPVNSATKQFSVFILTLNHCLYF